MRVEEAARDPVLAITAIIAIIAIIAITVIIAIMAIIFIIAIIAIIYINYTVVGDRVDADVAGAMRGVLGCGQLGSAPMGPLREQLYIHMTQIV